MVLGLARSDDARVRFFVALALGATADPRAADALAAIARRDGGDPWTRLAVLASSAAVADRLFAALAADRDFTSRDDGRAVLDSLAGVVGARNRPGEVAHALDAIEASDPARRAGSWSPWGGAWRGPGAGSTRVRRRSRRSSAGPSPRRAPRASRTRPAPRRSPCSDSARTPAPAARWPTSSTQAPRGSCRPPPSAPWRATRSRRSPASCSRG